MTIKAEIRWLVYKDTNRIHSAYATTTKNSEAELRSKIFSKCGSDFPDVDTATITREDNALSTKGYWQIECESSEHDFLLIISKLN